MDENEDVNLAGTNDPSLHMPQNNKIPVVDTELFEHHTKEYFIKDKNTNAMIPTLKPNPPTIEAAVITTVIASRT